MDSTQPAPAGSDAAGSEETKKPAAGPDGRRKKVTVGALVLLVLALHALIAALIVHFWSTRSPSSSPAGGPGGGGGGGGAAAKPNIVFILTDDQDLQMNSLDYMPSVHSNIAQNGITFNRHFATVSLCCPSRVSLLTGKAAHNTNVTSVVPPYGGYPKFISQGLNGNWLPSWMQQAGYSTYYAGKLMNSHNIDNYNNPFPLGFDGSDFLLEPGTYQYYNATFQRNRDAPVNELGLYSTDLVANKSLGFIDEGVASGKPFFLTIAPIAPHCNLGNPFPNGSANSTAPEPAARHADMFLDAQVPRTPNFNPSVSSGASWVRRLPVQSPENVEFNDQYYIKRLQALQAVDDLVTSTFDRLNSYGILNNTYVIFSSDNGYHIGQHRMQPGKQLPYEEDVSVPLIIRGPGIPAGQTRDFVTSHTDLAPTFLAMAGQPARSDLDGAAIPLTAPPASPDQPWEHTNIEHWGAAASDGDGGFGPVDHYNNTYKALRVYSANYSLFYSVWCTNDRELYDMQTDAYQMNNLAGSTTGTILGRSILTLQSRLDALLLVLKTCKTNSCTDPWGTLHPQGNVKTLTDALSPDYDDFYEKEQLRVSFSRCEAGQILSVEGALSALAFGGYQRQEDWAVWS